MRVFWKFLQLYLLLFLVCLTESLYAAPRYYFKQISLENGLSQSSVKYWGRNLLRIGIFRSWYFPEPAFESSSGNIYISGVEGLVRIRPGYDIHEEEDFSVSMINLALDGLPIHPDGISGEQAISIPWDYVSLGRGINQGRISIWRSRLI